MSEEIAARYAACSTAVQGTKLHISGTVSGTTSPNTFIP